MDSLYSFDSSPNTLFKIFAIGTSTALPNLQNVNVFEVGYGRKEGVMYNNNCENEFLITIPKFEGLNVGNHTKPTCDTCTDGKIAVMLTPTANCLDCTFGSVIILNSNNEDVTNLNNQSMLGRGKYKVIALDANTGCYIAHKFVDL